MTATGVLPCRYLLLLAVGFSLSACDTATPIFENANEDSRYFSLFGTVTYPGGGAIRVQPLRSPDVDSAFRGEETVTFTQTATEETDTLRLRSDSAEGVPVRNYRTPVGITRGDTYRIDVTRTGGAASGVEISIPAEKPKARVLDTLKYCRGRFGDRQARPVRLRIDSVENLGRIAVRYLTGFGLSAPFRVTNLAEEVNADTYEVVVPTDDHLGTIASRNRTIGGGFGSPPIALAQSVLSRVVSVGREIPAAELNPAELEELAVPGQYSNVEQGVGLVIGAYPVEVEIPVDPETSSPGADLPLCSN